MPALFTRPKGTSWPADPGGSANGVWKTWLRHVADLVHKFPDDGFVFRPFHEVTLKGRA